METISKNQRYLNILQKAVDNGFDFEIENTLEETLFEAESYLIDYTDAIEEECEVELNGRQQEVNYYDGMGYEYSCWGEIVDFRVYWGKSPDEKVFHTTVIDSKAQVVNLYYLVGETSLNKE